MIGSKAAFTTHTLIFASPPASIMNMPFISCGDSSDLTAGEPSLGNRR